MDKTALYGLGFLAGFAVLVVAFVCALRRKRRGEPVRDAVGGRAYPGDPRYELFWFYALKPYYILFGIIGLLLLMILFLVAQKFLGF
jgi:hypothetical protein